MTMPSWEHFMVPILRRLESGETVHNRELCDAGADALALSEEDRLGRIASGQERYVNRGLWALSHLSLGGAVERPTRGQYRITDRGRGLLAEHPDRLRNHDVPRLIPREGAPVATLEQPESDLPPIEQIDAGVEALHAEVAAELLQRLHQREPAFFEQAVLDLMMAMGYGGTDGRATRTQLSNDGGIDGVIDQDALGLSRVYVQAKRHLPGSSISRPDVQGFMGALDGHRASQGVFLTTASFSAGAFEYAENASRRIVLIDGTRLTDLMIHFGVGVQATRTVTIVEVDEDFFE